MSEEKSAVTAEIKVVDGVVIISAQADLIQVLKNLAKDSSNTVDDALVTMVEMAKGNLDWKGFAKGIL